MGCYCWSILAFVVILHSNVGQFWSVSADLGTITDFQQLDCTEDTITLEWSFVKGDVDISYYTLLNVEESFPTNVRCPLEYCTATVDFLAACSEYHFELTPHYADDIGTTEAALGHTKDILPGVPQNLEATGDGDPDVSLTWDAPTESAQCISGYQICTREQGAIHQDCFNTSETNFTLDDLQMCSHYFISVSGLTNLGGTGDRETVERDTVEGIPSEPQELQVKTVETESITITYKDPLINPLCVDGYYTSWEETNRDSLPQVNSFKQPSNKHCDPVCTETISPIPPCTNISIGVSARTHSELHGTAARVDTATEEIAPLAPPSIAVESLSPSVIQVSWTGNPTDKCASSVTICWIDEVVFQEVCEDIPIGDGDGSGLYNISQVYPCAKYEITVTVKSPSGLESAAKVMSHTTVDIASGPVTNLNIKEVGTTDVTFTYEPPTDNPQCSTNIETDYIDLTGGGTVAGHMEASVETLSAAALASDVSTVTKDGLLACTDYLIKVRSISSSGLMSAAENATTTTKSTVTSPPQKLATKYIELDSAQLEWVRPKDNYRCATSYELTLESRSNGTETYEIPTEKEGPIKMHFEVTDLIPCTDYDASLAALSDEGSSEPEVTSFKTLCE